WRTTMRSRPYNAHSHKEETYRSGEGSRGSRIEIRSGSEGPNFDPYHYDEITVTRADGRKATIHRGLAEWMRYWDGRFERRSNDSYAILRSKFEACVGCTPEEAERTFHRLKGAPHYASRLRHAAYQVGRRLSWRDIHALRQMRGHSRQFLRPLGNRLTFRARLLAGRVSEVPTGTSIRMENYDD